MKKTFRIRRLVIVLIACVLAVVALNAFRDDNNPSFEGKRLSAWVWQLQRPKSAMEAEEARAAIRGLGTNAVPLLLDWLRQADYGSPPSLGSKFEAICLRSYVWLVRHKLLPYRDNLMIREYKPDKVEQAIFTLPELDSASRQAAIPALIQMLVEKDADCANPSQAADLAQRVLSLMAPESIDPLAATLSNTDFQVRMRAAVALADIRPTAKAAIPVLDGILSQMEQATNQTEIYYRDLIKLLMLQQFVSPSVTSSTE